jgi:hypothetical protein
MNNLLKLWTALIKEAGFTYAEAYGILSYQDDGFRLLRSIHKTPAYLVMMMEDAKIYNKGVCIMYTDFKGTFDGLTT